MGGDWRRGALAVALALLIAVSATACSDRRSASPDPTLPRRTTTTDRFAVPDPIDVAYVERVMEALDHLYGEAAREVAKEKELTPRFEDLMRAIYGDDETLDLVLAGWDEEAAQGFPNLAPEPGDPETAIRTLLTARPDCVVAEVDRDFSPLLVTPRPPGDSEHFVVLVPDVSEANATGWRLQLDGFDDEGPVTEAACES